MTTRLCTEPGCTSAHLAKGYCRKHYRAHGLDTSHGRKYTMTAECKACGKTFSKATSNKQRMSSCSEACRVELGRRVNQAKRSNYPSSKIHIGACAQCGVWFSARRAGALYCANHRSSKAMYERGKDARLAKLRAAYEPKQSRHVQCERCGVPLVVKGPRKYCAACAIEADREVNGEANRRRRARKRGAECESFQAIEVYARDRWMCGICLLPVDGALRNPDIMSPSLDHIVPLARGGHHTRANTQLAHMICNSRKGDRTGWHPGTKPSLALA